MSDDLRDLLEQAREAGTGTDLPLVTKKKVTKKKPPVSMAPPDWPSVKWPTTPGYVLSVDQSLAHCGWVALKTGAGRIPEIDDFGTIDISAGSEKGKGFYDTMQRGDKLFGYFRDLLAEGDGVDVMVHEMPAVRGFRADSSMMASCRIRDAAITQELPILIVQAQHAKKTVTGNGNAKKIDCRPHLRGAYDQLGDPLPKMNEHEMDALLNGLAAAMDGTLETFLKQVAG
jgi:Holliday junction resolvasome RuvABC endonuclease subunit